MEEEYANMDPEPEIYDILDDGLCKIVDEEIYNEILEWNRMRDVVDDAEIALKGICQEVGASIIEGKIAAACRNLRDLIHTYHGLGD